MFGKLVTAAQTVATSIRLFRNSGSTGTSVCGTCGSIVGNGQVCGTCRV